MLASSVDAGLCRHASINTTARSADNRPPASHGPHRPIGDLRRRRVPAFGGPEVRRPEAAGRDAVPADREAAAVHMLGLRIGAGQLDAGLAKASGEGDGTAIAPLPGRQSAKMPGAEAVEGVSRRKARPLRRSAGPSTHNQQPTSRR